MKAAPKSGLFIVVETYNELNSKSSTIESTSVKPPAGGDRPGEARTHDLTDVNHPARTPYLSPYGYPDFTNRKDNDFEEP